MDFFIFVIGVVVGSQIFLYMGIMTLIGGKFGLVWSGVATLGVGYLILQDATAPLVIGFFVPFAVAIYLVVREIGDSLPESIGEYRNKTFISPSGNGNKNPADLANKSGPEKVLPASVIKPVTREGNPASERPPKRNYEPANKNELLARLMAAIAACDAQVIQIELDCVREIFLEKDFGSREWELFEYGKINFDDCFNLAAAYAQELGDDDKNEVVKALTRVARSDGQTNKYERKIIQTVRSGFNHSSK